MIEEKDLKFAIKHILNLGLAYIHIAKENKNVK